jgi:preprotein translocase subunit SecA
MLGSLAKSLFGDSNDRVVKKFVPMVSAVNELEERMAQLSDEDFPATTVAFKGPSGKW